MPTPSIPQKGTVRSRLIHALSTCDRTFSILRAFSLLCAGYSTLHFHTASGVWEIIMNVGMAVLSFLCFFLTQRAQEENYAILWRLRHIQRVLEMEEELRNPRNKRS